MKRIDLDFNRNVERQEDGRFASQQHVGLSCVVVLVVVFAPLVMWELFLPDVLTYGPIEEEFNSFVLHMFYSSCVHK